VGSSSSHFNDGGDGGSCKLDVGLSQPATRDVCLNYLFSSLVGKEPSPHLLLEGHVQFLLVLTNIY